MRHLPLKHAIQGRCSSRSIPGRLARHQADCSRCSAAGKMGRAESLQTGIRCNPVHITSRCPTMCVRLEMVGASKMSALYSNLPASPSSRSRGVRSVTSNFRRLSIRALRPASRSLREMHQRALRYFAANVTEQRSAIGCRAGCNSSTSFKQPHPGLARPIRPTRFAWRVGTV